MAETRNGTEFLEDLRKQNGKQNQTFNAFYSFLEKKPETRRFLLAVSLN